jgi:hypothetical protein
VAKICFRRIENFFSSNRKNCFGHFLTIFVAKLNEIEILFNETFLPDLTADDVFLRKESLI